MIKILFVCHGNICRSPMAEFVMKDMVEKRGIAHKYEIASCATSTEELGNSVYPPARAKLAENGISCKGKTARQMTKEDYHNFDYIIGMDSYNIRNILRIIGADTEDKVCKLLDFANGGDIADPWYTGNFEDTFRDVVAGCKGLLNSLFSLT